MALLTEMKIPYLHASVLPSHRSASRLPRRERRKATSPQQLRDEHVNIRIQVDLRKKPHSSDDSLRTDGCSFSSGMRFCSMCSWMSSR